MRNRAVVILLIAVFALAQPAMADECTGGIWIGSLNFGGQCTYGPTSNTIDPVVEKELYDRLKEAADSINAMPDQIRKAGPQQQTLTSGIEGAKQIFGYVKWMFSPNSAQEALGKTLAPIGINVMVIFLMVIALVTIYITLNIAIFIIKFIVWLINQILKLIPFW